MTPAPGREEMPPDRTGRPPVNDTIVALTARMTRENTGRGYRRIQGEPLKLGHRVAAATARRVLRRLRVPCAARKVIVARH
jgi:hypothetical protein